MMVWELTPRGREVVEHDRREPTAWYCLQCVGIVTTLEEKQLHERLHGHTMEIPDP